MVVPTATLAVQTDLPLFSPRANAINWRRLTLLQLSPFGWILVVFAAARLLPDKYWVHFIRGVIASAASAKTIDVHWLCATAALVGIYAQMAADSSPATEPTGKRQ